MDVLKNPHHCNTLGAIYEWFGMKYAVVSTDSENPPDDDLLAWMERLGVNLYVTSPDHNGKVLMITDGKEIEFYTAY